MWRAGHLRALVWYSSAFLVSLVARVVYSTALSTWASILPKERWGQSLLNPVPELVPVPLPFLPLLLLLQLPPVDHLPLVLHQHGDVHEHLVQLLDRLLQLDEHLVPDSSHSISG